MHISRMTVVLGSHVIASISAHALPGGVVANDFGLVERSLVPAGQTVCGLLDLGCWLGNVVTLVGGVAFDLLGIVNQVIVFLETGIALEFWLVEAFLQTGSLSSVSVGAFVAAGQQLLKTPHQTYYGTTSTQFAAFCNELDTTYYVTNTPITQAQFNALATKYNVDFSKGST